MLPSVRLPLYQIFNRGRIGDPPLLLRRDEHRTKKGHRTKRCRGRRTHRRTVSVPRLVLFCFSERSLKSRAAVGWLLGDRWDGGLLDKEGRKGRSEQQGARRQGGWSSSRRFPSAGMCEQGARDDDERGRFSRQRTEIRHCAVVLGRHSMSAAGVSDRYFRRFLPAWL